MTLQPATIRRRLFKPVQTSLLIVLSMVASACSNLEAQETELVSPEWILEQIDSLSHESYRTRQKARANLEAHPRESLEAIRTNASQVRSVVGIQLIDILSGLAIHNDLSISTTATEILLSLANDVTSVGRAASNSMSAISDLQEAKAEEILRGCGVWVGPQDFTLNAAVLSEQTARPKSLRIDEQFFGTDSELDWIRHLKSVRAVYLRGSKITPTAIKAVSQLKNLTAVKLRSVPLTAEQLLLFRDLVNLEHLELSYMDVDDLFVSSILQLPISQSIRLYGTDVTKDGENMLAEQFDDLEIFRGSGGFLGVSTAEKPARVGRVTPNSAAERAGIVPNDLIVSIDQVPIDSFQQLRSQLGTFRAGQTVEIRLLRPSYDPLEEKSKEVELTVKATLQEEID